jgi:SAM-dependent methyltransferase
VGCALGYFGKVADERGWEVLITDISEFAVMKASQDFHLRGFVSPAGKIPVKEKKFDLITMFDVLEHISHPRELLDQVRRSLDPRGVVHLTTPNVTSLSARVLGKRWYHFKPEEHLIYFSPKTLQLALEKSGFEVLKIQPVHSYMAVGDILMRLRAYSQKLSDFGLKVAKLLHLDRKVIRVATGRVEAWARPRAAEVSATGARKAFPVERETTPILGLVCCPNCKGELYPEGEELTCMLCDSIFAIEFGVINFSKYTKKLHRKSV